MFATCISSGLIGLVALALSAGGCGTSAGDQTVPGTTTATTVVASVEVDPTAGHAAEPCGFCELDGTVHPDCGPRAR